MAFLVVQTIYWLALATWFGGVLFVSIMTPLVFSTIEEANPLLPTVLSVNLDKKHATLLAGTVVGNMLMRLTRVQVACGGTVILGCLTQWFIASTQNPQELVAAIVRSALAVVAMLVVLYDARKVWPKMWKFRQDYLDHADEPDIANPAKEQFDRLHRTSVTLLSVVLCMLLGMILFSANIVPRYQTIFAR